MNPTELCAFCACKQRPPPTTRPFASSACKQRQRPNNASDDDTYTHNTDAPTSLAFSVYHRKRRPKNRSATNAGHTTNATTTLLTLSLYNKPPQPNTAPNDGTCTNNYYACLDDNDTENENDCWKGLRNGLRTDEMRPYPNGYRKTQDDPTQMTFATTKTSLSLLLTSIN